MWGRRKNLELKKKSQIQSLRWILYKVNRKVALEPIFKNLLNLELLEKYLKIDQRSDYSGLCSHLPSSL